MKIAIPACLTLDDAQQKKLQEFGNFLDTIPNGDETDEDCCGTSPVTFIAIESGIGCSLRATAFGHVCQLTIDDDGEMIEGYDTWRNL